MINTRNFTPDARQQKRIISLGTSQYVADVIAGRRRMVWQSSKTDLLELLHIAYMAGTIAEPDGQQARYSYIIKAVLEILNIPVPANPYKHASRAQQKKGERYVCLADRLNNELFHRGCYPMQIDDLGRFTCCQRPLGDAIEKVLRVTLCVS